jgi:hypothetical protein
LFLREALLFSDFVAIRRYSQKISPYIVHYAAAIFFARASPRLELEKNQGFLEADYSNGFRLTLPRQVSIIHSSAFDLFSWRK